MIQCLKSYLTPLRLVDAEGFCPRRFASAGAGLLLLVTLLLAAIPSRAAEQKGLSAVIFVDALATGANTGTSWEDAFLDLQSALDAVTRGNFDQIWVACAEYRPTRSVFKSEDPRTFSFTIDADLRLFGGFVGGETALEERNPDPRSNGCVLGVAPGSSESEATRPYSVLRMESAGQPVLIDGFTISGGRATGPIDEESQGAGIRAVDSRLTLRSMHFEDLVAANNGAGRGAGVFAENAELVLEDVSMLNVSAGRGGGLACSSPRWMQPASA